MSDTDIQIFIRQMNNIEQCIFPELGQKNYQQVYNSLTEKDRLLMRYYREKVLEDLISLENIIKIAQDPESRDYFSKQVNKFNHQRASVSPELCDKFKIEYQQKYQQVQEMMNKDDG
ncbi:DUF5358 family protein [Nicoletella semolina]|nr:DUF5358 family protein [Nicoletella semolina]